MKNENIEIVTEQTICTWLRTILLNFYLDCPKTKDGDKAMDSVITSFRHEPRHMVN